MEMTPKEKAKELYNKYSVYNVNGKSIMKIGPEVKVFTLIAVNLLMEEAYRQHDYEGFKAYWKEVKNEISNL
jgi:hypothetical protein